MNLSKPGDERIYKKTLFRNGHYTIICITTTSIIRHRPTPNTSKLNNTNPRSIPYITPSAKHERQKQKCQSTPYTSRTRWNSNFSQREGRRSARSANAVPRPRTYTATNNTTTTTTTQPHGRNPPPSIGGIRAHPAERKGAHSSRSTCRCAPVDFRNPREPLWRFPLCKALILHAS